MSRITFVFMASLAWVSAWNERLRSDVMQPIKSSPALQRRRDFIQQSLAGIGAVQVLMVEGAQQAQAADATSESSSVFTGRYSDPNHPGGYREVTLLDTRVGDFQLAQVTGGGGRGEPASFTLNAMVQQPDKRIIIDFRPKGGPKDFPGVWEDDGIRFIDGNKWPKQK